MVSLKMVATESEQKLARLDRYLLADPRNLSLLATIIDLSLELGQIDRAEKCVLEALQFYPDDATMFCRHGLVLMEQGNFDAAAQVFEKLLASISDVSIATNLAFIYLQRGRYKDAADALSQYVSVSDLSSETLTLYIRALHHQGELKQALEIVHRNRERCSSDSAFLATASLVCLDDERIEEARELSEAALVAGGRPLEALVVVGTIALSDLEAKVAAVHFQEAITINPKDGRSWSGLGLSSLLMQDIEGAMEQLTLAVKYMPEHIGTLHALGWSKILGRDIVSAQVYFEKALSMDRNFSESHGGMAVVFALQGHSKLAEESIARALRLNARCLSARFAQMALAGTLNDPETFRGIVLRVLSQHEGVEGANMANMLTNFMSR